MSYQIKCLACGKLFPMPPGAGQEVLCIACGTWLTLPPLPDQPPPDVSSEPAPVRPVTNGHNTYNPQPDPVVPTAIAVKPARRHSTGRRAAFYALLMLAGAAVAVLIAAVALPGSFARKSSPEVRNPDPTPNPAPTHNPNRITLPDEPWERVMHSRLVQMKNEAEELAVQGKLVEAHKKYRDLQARIAGRRITDPILWDLMDRAKQDMDRVYAMILAEQEAARLAKLRTPNTAGPTTAGTAEPYVRNPDPPKVDTPKTDNISPTTKDVRTVAATAAVNPATTTVANTKPATNTTTEPTFAIVQPAADKGLPAVRRLPKPTSVSDLQIGQSIARGVDFIIANIENNEVKIGRDTGDNYHDGLNALCVLALLHAGQASHDERLSIHSPYMKGLIDRMKEHLMMADPQAEHGAPVTYARSLRAAALAVYNRAEDRKILEADAAWLIEAHSNGAYTYDNRWGRGADRLPDTPQYRELPGSARKDRTLYYIDPTTRPTYLDGVHDKLGREVGPPAQPRYRPRLPDGSYAPDNTVWPWDNSNSQYGLLGVWSAAECGYEVPEKYWRAVQQHWSTCQLADGQWAYSRGSKDGYLAMTAAGCASMFVTYDYLDASTAGAGVGAKPAPLPAALTKGLAWLDAGDNSMNVMAGKVVYLGYTLFSLERVGLASGLKYFGAHDWYRELATRVVLSQFKNGAWGRKNEGTEALIDTAFMVLFLSRGRHPVMMNKLRVDDTWLSRPRELANLCRFAGRELERPRNWQIVTLNRDWSDWLDSPLLYITSSGYPKLKDADLEKIRRYAENGGLIFTHAENNSEAFNRWIAEIAPKLFPTYEMQDLPADHEIYNITFKIVHPQPKLRGISNGARLLLVHSPTDLSAAWQQRTEKTRRAFFELGANLNVYAAGKIGHRNRLVQMTLPPFTEKHSAAIKLARLQYAGNWDPEPAAWTRFARYFEWETGMNLQPAVAPAESVDFRSYPVAHLTGTGNYTPTEAESTGIRKYVESGGVLLIDAAGGAGPFSTSVPKLLELTFPESKLGQPVPLKHAIYSPTFNGMEDLSQVLLRPGTGEKYGQAPHVRLLRFGRGCVIFCPVDLTASLTGTSTYGVYGYPPRYAQDLTKNVLLWGLNGGRE